MSSANLPIIVIVPGAFGTPEGFDKLLPYLTEAGYTTHPGSYPSCNSSDPTQESSPQDIAYLRDNVLLPLLNEDGRDVVIIAHSYGGVVAGGAAKGLAKETRIAQGQSTGIVGLIYVVGNITLDGESLFQAVGGAYPPFIKVNKPSQGLAVIEPAMDVLYNDCDRALQPELDTLMQPHALRAFETPATAPAWAESAFDGRRAYVRTLDDCCNPASLQDIWLEKSKVEWEVVDFKTGHMPFVSQPQALAEQITKFIDGFIAK
ncbi:esterase/lipase family protein [Aspergillus vadensis CBS 113365]|uniref:Alpha/beta-hydrolase n=1 Tax=Aspergillus vadensis (strain CBS 113365 / IMI 142717 / IBT 24658) TaxID=1448311 RepID=A0A319BP43_ASPVC|nr:alpha/beta-hydrolase [Aspergillus vadensis CBS 113365]PYH67483.1 alpha/beta-hydrolase [Aspergillus vadensis CBS 113365]